MVLIERVEDPDELCPSLPFAKDNLPNSSTLEPREINRSVVEISLSAEERRGSCRWERSRRDALEDQLERLLSPGRR